MLHRMLMSVAAISLVTIPVACAPREEPPVVPEPDPMALPVPEDPAVRIRELKTRVDQLASFADQLPGRDEEAYRPLMSQGLADLAHALRLAQPPGSNGAFRVQFYSMHEASRQLQTRSLEFPLRPQTTAALRSAHNALESLQQQRFAENADLEAEVQRLGGTLAALETSQGALYRVASAESFTQAVKAMQLVAELYAMRLPADGPATQVTTPAPAAPESDGSESSAAPADDAPAPADNAPAPADNAPAPADNAPAPADAAPAPAADAPAPAPETQAPAPAPETQAPAPAPETQVPAPAPNADAPAPAPEPAQPEINK